MFFYRGPGAGVSNLMATQSIGPRTASLLATSGVLAQHPELHVVFVEYNAGWLAWTMQTLDFYTEAFGRYGTTPNGKPWVDPSLPEPPSAYLRPAGARHVPGRSRRGAQHRAHRRVRAHVGQRLPARGRHVPRVHARWWPASPANLSPEDAAAVFTRNAADVFGFDLDALGSPD